MDPNPHAPENGEPGSSRYSKGFMALEQETILRKWEHFTDEVLIPIDEAHRFLQWQERRWMIDPWCRWLCSRRTPHVLVVSANGWWTIAKQMWKPYDEADPTKGRWI